MADKDHDQKGDESDGEIDEKSFQEEEKKKAINDRILRAREEQQARETRALLAWANILLKQRNMQGTVLSHYHDGVLLINLLEVAFNDPIGRYIATPKMSIQKHENVSKGLKYMDEHKIPYPSVDSHHIVEAQSKQIVVVLWNILRCYMIRGLKSGGEVPADTSDSALRKTLLEWGNNALAADDLKITLENFGSHFRDGIALCALVHHLVPHNGKIQVDKLKTSEGAQNLQLAFDIALEHLGIPPLFDAKKFASGEEGTDEDMLKYLAMLVAAHQAKKTIQLVEGHATLVEAADDAEEKRRLAEEELARKRLEEKKKFDELQAKLKADLEEANRKAAEAQDEMARLLAEKDKQIKALELRVAELEAKSKLCHDEKAALQRIIDELRANAKLDKKEIADMASQTYALHKDYEEICARVREEKTIRDNEAAEATFTYQRRHRRHYSRDLENKNRVEEPVLSMKDLAGHLLRRRPNAMFNRKRFKVLYFKLSGEQIDYFESEGGKQKGTMKLRDYDYAEQSSTRGDKFSFRLVPSAKLGTHKLIEFKNLQGEEEDNDKYIKQWFYQVNRRIALMQYFKEVEEKKQPGCEELVGFVMNDLATSLVIEHDRLVGFFEATKTLKRAISYRPNLKKIVLDDIEVDDKMVTAIAEVLTFSEYIEVLELPNNKITHEGAISLAAALRLNQSLTELDLTNNGLKDRGVKELTQVLPDHPAMRKLGFNGNGVTDEGIEWLIKGLAESEKQNGKPHNYHSVEFMSNMIGDKGVARIAELCKLNPTIASINLEHNRVTDKGCEALADIITVGSKAQVTSINVASNQISSKGLIALSQALKRTYYALTINVSHNPLIGRKGIESITDAELSLDWILLKVRSQVSREDAAVMPKAADHVKIQAAGRAADEARRTQQAAGGSPGGRSASPSPGRSASPSPGRSASPTGDPKVPKKK